MFAYFKMKLSLHRYPREFQSASRRKAARLQGSALPLSYARVFSNLSKKRSLVLYTKYTFRQILIVPMNGIEPFFEAYESPVLPLNYIGIYMKKLFGKITCLI